MTKPPVRIGNAQGFWGDRAEAAAELLAREPNLDYLTMDYLAEVSMSILAAQRERDPSAGYAHDFVDVVQSLAPYWAGGGRCRLIANAGGLNPRACARACATVLEAAGCPAIKIAVVAGDDVLGQLQSASRDPNSSPFQNLDTAASWATVQNRLVTANAYLGAAPLADALAAGAHIVITGRVADPSLTVAPCRHHFGWSEVDWNRLAGATVAGHLIECGTQVTGGISTDWLDIPDPAHIGFPIVEVAEDGRCMVTMPPGAGGRVTADTVKEQLLYEIGDPDAYLSPDVTASFLSLSVVDLGDNRVQVCGARGRPAPSTLKVSATSRDGYRAAGTLTIIGRNAVEKARRCGAIVLQQVCEAGHVLRDSVIECLGASEAPDGPSTCNPSPTTDFETVLRIAVEAETREAVDCFSRMLMPLITAGPPGTTGYADGRPRVHPVIRYWPCLIDRAQVTPTVEFIETNHSGAPPQSWPKLPTSANAVGPTPAFVADSFRPSSVNHQPSTLYKLARARSGDKGLSANIGVLARDPNDYPFLSDWLTAERVRDFFAPFGVDAVERYAVPNLFGLNFILRGILRSSLRTDAQGKALGQRLLQMPLPGPLDKLT